MNLIKRITILAAATCTVASLSGCDWLIESYCYEYGRGGGNREALRVACEAELADKQRQAETPPIPVPVDETPAPVDGVPEPPTSEPPTSPPDPPPPSPDPHRGEGARASAGSASVAAASRTSKPFGARLSGKRLGLPAVSTRPGGVRASNLVARGRFQISLGGDARLRRRFSRGRWIARADASYTLASGKLSWNGYMLLRFGRRGAGSVCLSVRGRRVRARPGKGFRMRGGFVALGGTGEAARIIVSGSFSDPGGGRSITLRGRSRLRLGTRRPLPALCAALAQMR